MLKVLIILAAFQVAPTKKPTTTPVKPAPAPVVYKHYVKRISDKTIHVHCVPGTHVGSARQINPTTITVTCDPNKQ